MSINLYEITKDAFKNLFSFKFQNCTLISIVILAVFKKILPQDFNIIAKKIDYIIPNNIKEFMQPLIIPCIQTLLFIATIGTVLGLLVAILFGLKESKGLFKSFVYNYNKHFRGGQTGILDNLVGKLVSRPVNISLIILGIHYLFNGSKLIESYFVNFSILHIPVYISVCFYFIIVTQFFFTAESND